MSLLAARRHLATRLLDARRAEVRTRLDAWANAAADRNGGLAVYGSHLRRLRPWFDGAFAVVEAELGPARTVERCITAETRLLTIAGAFEPFADALDARTAGTHGTLLRAADEVIYAMLLRMPAASAGGPKPLRPPLPALRNRYSPAAAPEDIQGRLELGQRGTDDPFAKGPLALLWLSPGMAVAPWWLLLLAHEFGHLVQHDAEVVGRFTNSVAKISVDWKPWSEEVFADLVSAAILGPWAGWILEEAAAGAGDTNGPRHPRIGLRMALLDAAVRARWGLDPTHWHRGDWAAPTMDEADAAARLGALVSQPASDGGLALGQWVRGTAGNAVGVLSGQLQAWNGTDPLQRGNHDALDALVAVARAAHAADEATLEKAASAGLAFVAAFGSDVPPSDRAPLSDTELNTERDAGAEFARALR